MYACMHVCTYFGKWVGRYIYTHVRPTISSCRQHYPTLCQDWAPGVLNSTGLRKCWTTSGRDIHVELSHPTPQDTRQIFPDPLLAADTSWDSSGNPRILQLPQEVEGPTENTKENSQPPLFPNFGILGIFSTVSKIIDLSISFCLSEGLDFWMFLRHGKIPKMPSCSFCLIQPGHIGKLHLCGSVCLRFPVAEASAMLVLTDLSNSRWPFNHLILILRVYDQPEVSWLLLLHFVMSCQDFDVLPEFSKLPPPQLRRKKNPDLGTTQLLECQKNPFRKGPKKKQTNHIGKKKAALLTCFFPTGQGFHRWRLKKPTFPPKKNHHPKNPLFQLIQKKRTTTTDTKIPTKQFSNRPPPLTPPWISHPWRPVERLYQYWKCFDHLLQDLLAYLGIQTDESEKPPRKSDGV